MSRRKLLSFRVQEHHFLKNMLLHVVSLLVRNMFIGRGGIINNKGGHHPSEALPVRTSRVHGEHPRRGGLCPETQQHQLRVRRLRQDLRLTLLWELLGAEPRRKLLAPRLSDQVRPLLHQRR